MGLAQGRNPDFYGGAHRGSSSSVAFFISASSSAIGALPAVMVSNTFIRLQAELFD